VEQTKGYPIETTGLTGIGGGPILFGMRNIQTRPIAPLQMMPALWRARLETLVLDAECAAPEEGAALLRRLQRLIAAAPHAAAQGGAQGDGQGGVDAGAGWSVGSPGMGDAPAFEAMLAAGADTSAALAMLPKRAAWMLSARAGGAMHLATILLPGMLDEVTGQGATPALALVSTMAMAFAGDAPGQFGADLEEGPSPYLA